MQSMSAVLIESDCDYKLQREVVLISQGHFSSKPILVDLWKNETEMWIYEDFVPFSNLEFLKELSTGVYIVHI